MPKSMVVDTAFEWADDHRPRTPWHDTVIYETHVRGLTWRHPEVPPAQRGTYAGVAHPAMIDHFQRLGITAVELMPVHQFIDDHHLVKKGLRNYWGYNSIGFFAPHNGYASRPGQRVVNEFKTMVRALHAAGIEVILDVVYNHTAEGNHLGPTLSFRGLDNAELLPARPRQPPPVLRYHGHGQHPQRQQPPDLAAPHGLVAVLGPRNARRRVPLRPRRQPGPPVPRGRQALRFLRPDPPGPGDQPDQADRRTVGPRVGGYQVGNFPVLWSEWNGRYRDSVRDYWRQQSTSIGELAHRLTGSSDLYEATGRRPWASVNFVTAHDGFTLADLVSYNDKHNEANGEDNRDGTDDNRSWNCGVEGPTDDPAVVRSAQAPGPQLPDHPGPVRSGCPCCSAATRSGRTQRGNNNAYCQDNEISWYDWDNVDTDLLAWTRRCRPAAGPPCVPPAAVLPGPAAAPARTPTRPRPSIGWFRPDGHLDDRLRLGGRATPSRSAVLFNGSSPTERRPARPPLPDASFYLALNAWEQPARASGSRAEVGRRCGRWSSTRPMTGLSTSPDSSTPVARLPLLGHHFVVLQQPRRRPVAGPPG